MSRLRTLLLLLLAGFAPFAVLEAVLWGVDYRPPDAWFYEGFQRDRPIFDVKDGVARLAPGQERTFHSREFLEPRPPGERLIFCVGDSVVWGFGGNDVPDPQTTFVELLEEKLSGRPGEATTRVVNCGARTYASGRVSLVLQDVLRHRPDAVVASFGSSELLEATVFRAFLQKQSRFPGWLWNLRLMAWLEVGVRSLKGQSEGLTVSDLRQRTDSMESAFLKTVETAGSRVEMGRILEQAESNVRSMVRSCQEAKVPLVLLTVPSNLLFPPFGSDCPTPELCVKVREVVRLSQELLDANRPGEALKLLEGEGIPRDGVASIHFLRGRAHEMLREDDEAFAEYVKARDSDAFPLRAVGPFNDMIRRMGEAEGVTVVDVVKIVGRMDARGIPGDDLFIDRCHLRPNAHEAIAEALSHLF